MSIAIKFGDETNENSLAGVLYIDATTDFNRDYSGKVTEHPIEAGASITDHFISSNPKIKITGVFSHVDFSQYPKNIRIGDNDLVMNANSRPTAVGASDIGTSLSRFIPGAISQFLPNVPTNVSIDTGARVNYRDFIETFMRELITGLYYNKDRERWENRMTPSTIYVVERGIPLPFMSDVVLVNFSIKEDADTGEALFFDSSFEKVNFVTLEKAEAPKPERNTADSRATTKTENKGNPASTGSQSANERAPLTASEQFDKARGN